MVDVPVDPVGVVARERPWLPPRRGRARTAGRPRRGGRRPACPSAGPGRRRCAGPPGRERRSRSRRSRGTPPARCRAWRPRPGSRPGGGRRDRCRRPGGRSPGAVGRHDQDHPPAPPDGPSDGAPGEDGLVVRMGVQRHQDGSHATHPTVPWSSAPRSSRPETHRRDPPARGNPEIRQGCRGQTRRVAGRAHDDDRLIVVRTSGMRWSPPDRGATRARCRSMPRRPAARPPHGAGPRAGCRSPDRHGRSPRPLRGWHPPDPAPGSRHEFVNTRSRRCLPLSVPSRADGDEQRAVPGSKNVMVRRGGEYTWMLRAGPGPD